MFNFSPLCLRSELWLICSKLSLFSHFITPDGELPDGGKKIKTSAVKTQTAPAGHATEFYTAASAWGTEAGWRSSFQNRALTLDAPSRVQHAHTLLFMNGGNSAHTHTRVCRSLVGSMPTAIQLTRFNTCMVAMAAAASATHPL